MIKALRAVLWSALLSFSASNLAAQSVSAPAVETYLSSLRSLRDYSQGNARLELTEIVDIAQFLHKNSDAIAQSEATVKESIEFLEAYDQSFGPLWVKKRALNRKEQGGEAAIHWAAFYVMQSLVDQLYNNANLARYREYLEDLKFASADIFPGKVEEPISSVNRVKVNGSYEKTWGSPIFHYERPARKPTGSYLVPGTIATVIVPESIVGKGYQIRVGAHSWDFNKKGNVVRLDRVTTVFDIDKRQIEVANPLGGGIYLEVPYLANAGVIDIEIRDAARAPYFSAKSFHATKPTEWKTRERNFKSPWTDLQTDKFMMQVPTSFIYAMDDPSEVLSEWDNAMDVLNDLMGRPRLYGKETMYLQVDLLIRGSAFHPGYPSTNDRYDPRHDYGGNHNTYLLRGPRYVPHQVFHEQGHAFLFQKFKGDQEAVVNLPHVTVMNHLYGMEINEAFRSSRSDKNEFNTLENIAVGWMVTETFIAGKPISGEEKQYQPKGHAKFVDVARLLGWGALRKFFQSFQVDFENGIVWPRNVERDVYTHQMCKTIGVDVRPLMHFWGETIEDIEASNAFIEENDIQASEKIRQLLISYREAIPKDNEALRDYMMQRWKREPRESGYITERHHASQWQNYDEDTAALIRSRVDGILAMYFSK